MQWHSVLFSSLPASKNAVASPSWKYAFSCDASQQRRRACSAAPASVPSTRRGGSDIGEPLKAPVSLSIDTNTAYPHRSKGTEGLNGRVPEPAALPKHIAVSDLLLPLRNGPRVFETSVLLTVHAFISIKELLNTLFHRS